MEKDCGHDMGWKPSVSIVGGVGWLIFVIVWLAFYASGYSWEKNFSVILLSILVVFLLLGGMWAIWSLRMIPARGWEMFRIRGFKWRILVSIVLPLAAMIFLIVWFWYYAEPYSVWQNIAVLLVVLLAIGGILGAIWARWGMKHGHEMKKFEDMGEEIGKKVEDAVKDKESEESKD
jgi:magnesium-transporting ATPase (P-type)